MPVRKLSKQFRDSLKTMVHHFGFHNDKQLPESDKTILGAIHSEIENADEVNLNIKVGKDGKVTVTCNDIRYKFDDPTKGT